MKQTETYQFKLMENTDSFSPEPINANTQAIEARLAELAGRAGVAAGTYTGTGAAAGLTVELGFRPALVILCCTHTVSGGYSAPQLALVGEGGCFFTRRDGYCYWYSNLTALTDSGFAILGSANDNKVYLFNVEGKTYHYFALR